MAWVNIYEQPITPVVDLDTDVVVYVPGYAVKGPAEPTLVNSDTFTTIFGQAPYIFNTNQTAVVSKNNALKGTREKSWLYAKGLVDAGLTVLYHRYQPEGVEYAKVENVGQLEVNGKPVTLDDLQIGIRSKYFGAYYDNTKITIEKLSNGVSSVTVKDALGTTLESSNISLNPDSSNYFGSLSFNTIEFFGKDSETNAEVSFNDLCDIIAARVGENFRTSWISLTSNPAVLRVPSATTDQPSDTFVVSDFEKALVGQTSFFADILKDTEKYPVSYITTGGYFVSTANLTPERLLNLAADIKACYSADFADALTASNNGVNIYRQNIQEKVSVDDILNFSQGFQVVGADTFKVDGIRALLPDSFGYFVRLGANISAGLPYYTPVANNAQGIVANAYASTRPIDYEIESQLISDEGVSVNPIITKKNVGYVIMGNRTLYPNDGVLGPQSFLNCRVVVNTIERSARRAANQLRIVSTNADTAFKNFRNAVEKTCDKLLTNGDGLAEYAITKLPKTKPATIDIQIRLVVVEGIETWNLYIPYSIALD